MRNSTRKTALLGLIVLLLMIALRMLLVFSGPLPRWSTEFESLNRPGVAARKSPGARPPRSRNSRLINMHSRITSAIHCAIMRDAGRSSGDHNARKTIG